MKLEKLIEGLNIIEVKGSLEVDITSVAHDSRKARAGSAFVCIKGFEADGHRFIPSVAENGAAAVIIQDEMEVPAGMTAIRVDNTRYALAKISDTFFGHPSGKFSLIGITGTKGKTTTTYMMKSILEAAGQKVGLIGTIGSMIGNEVLYTERTTPESYELQSIFAEMAEKHVDSTVMEVSSQGLKLHRVSCCDFDTGIFTNISMDHIGPREHESFEEYMDSKKKLFKMCRTGFVNIDNKYGSEIVKSAECKVYSIGIDNEADIMAQDLVFHSDSVEFTACTPWGSGRIRVNIPGKFSIYNALSAIGVCAYKGIPFEIIGQGLENICVPGRAEVIYTCRDFTIMRDYAHTPDSLENILGTVKNFAPGRLVCLFGCGGDRDRTKRPIMGEISGNVADYTIITSDNPRTEDPEAIVKEIEQGIKRTSGSYTVIVDRREAIRHAIVNVQPKDVIVLAGKGHETYQIFKDKTIHFDEREVVEEILDEIHRGNADANAKV